MVGACGGFRSRGTTCVVGGGGLRFYTGTRSSRTHLAVLFHRPKLAGNWQQNAQKPSVVCMHLSYRCAALRWPSVSPMLPLLCGKQEGSTRALRNREKGCPVKLHSTTTVAAALGPRPGAPDPRSGIGLPALTSPSGGEPCLQANALQAWSPDRNSSRKSPLRPSAAVNPPSGRHLLGRHPGHPGVVHSELIQPEAHEGVGATTGMDDQGNAEELGPTAGRRPGGADKLGQLGGELGYLAEVGQPGRGGVITDSAHLVPRSSSHEAVARVLEHLARKRTELQEHLRLRSDVHLPEVHVPEVHLPSLSRIPSVQDLSASTKVFAAATRAAVGQRMGVGPASSVFELERKRAGSGGGLGASRYATRRGNPFLIGNFAPLRDERRTPQQCQVLGAIPVDLRGKLLRNGPNPLLPPDELTYHWFDGDGMVHCVEFREEGVYHSSHYVRTTGWQEERLAGRPLFQGLSGKGSPLGMPQLRVALLNFLQLRRQDGPYWNLSKNSSNNHLVHHAGKLLSLFEAGLPYELDPQDLSTVGVCDFEGRWGAGFTAHPKLDPHSHHLMFYGYNLTHEPYLQYGVLGPDGSLVHKCDIILPQPVMMHDFAVTPNHTLLLDFPLRFQLSKIIETQGQAKPFAFDPSQPSRIGVMPRFGTDDEIQWFTVSPGFCLHSLNAHEEEDYVGDVTVVLRAFRFDAFSGLGMAELPPHLQSHEVCRLHEYRLHLGHGHASERPLSPVCSDFPAMNPNFVGIPMRFGYSARFATQPGPGNGAPLFDAVLKHDLLTGAVAAHEFGSQRYAGEPVFVPRSPRLREDPSAPPGEPQSKAPGTASVLREAHENPHALPLWAHDMLTTAPRTKQRGEGGKGEGGTGFRRAQSLLKYASAGLKEDGARWRDDDDDGYVLVHVWDEAELQSELLVLDAADIGREPLARVVLPSRVPFGFHGIFLPASALLPPS